MGSIVRFNIQYTEPLVEGEQKDKKIKILNNISNVILGISYFISIAFYVRILSAFALKIFNIENDIISDVLTTIILFGIGLNGYFRGFDWLETLTEYSVNVKISVIMMFLFGLFLYDWFVLGFHYTSPKYHADLSWTMIRKVFGILLIVQGFEISRYIGHKYSAVLRSKTMKLAQIISSLIYIAFVYLIMFLMSAHEHESETEIINISRHVSIMLPYAITVGAIFSQFSAAIADTVGCGGTIIESFRIRISLNTAYLLITCVAIILIWTFNVFEIINFASRTFAAYYCTQCLHAIYVNQVYKMKGLFWSVYSAAVGSIMFMIALFGIPAD